MKKLRVWMLAGLLASLLLALMPAGPVSAFAQPVDCQGLMSLGGVTFGGGSIIFPADFSIALPTRYKWEPGDNIRITAQRPTGTTLEIWLDDELAASGPYPELTYTFIKRQIAYLTVVYRSQEADAMSSYSLVVTCPA
jgi:hypothetical protein